MKIVKANRLYCEPSILYKKVQKAIKDKANTKSQRALLGYMAKGGFIRDPIYVGAFRLVREIESCDGIYVIETTENPKVAMEIINIAEATMKGMWDEFAFHEREIKNIAIQFGYFQSLGGK